MTAFTLYLAACALPAVDQWELPSGGYSTNDPNHGEYYKSIPGWQCLLFGWLPVLSAIDVLEAGNIGWMAWLANPLALVGVLLLLFRRAGGALLAAGVGIALGTLYLVYPPRIHDHPDIPRIGAFLWLASLVLLALAALLRRANSPIEKPTAP
jgi:drug/metabolite transporter (DMT)-like permease